MGYVLLFSRVNIKYCPEISSDGDDDVVDDDGAAEPDLDEPPDSLTADELVEDSNKLSGLLAKVKAHLWKPK